MIKIEQPGLGDETRTWKTQAEAAKWSSKSMSLYFSAVNRNKRSVTLDLKQDKGLDILSELVKTSDILYVQTPGLFDHVHRRDDR